MAIFHQLLPLIRQRTPYFSEKSGLARLQVAKIRACIGEAQSVVRPTAYFTSIVFILTVIFPEADRTDFVLPSPMQSLEAAAWASI
jgi:hypothetical protein